MDWYYTFDHFIKHINISKYYNFYHTQSRVMIKASWKKIWLIIIWLCIIQSYCFEFYPCRQVYEMSTNYIRHHSPTTSVRHTNTNPDSSKPYTIHQLSSFTLTFIHHNSQLSQNHTNPSMSITQLNYKLNFTSNHTCQSPCHLSLVAPGRQENRKVTTGESKNVCRQRWDYLRR